jgi:hypothetical protein
MLGKVWLFRYWRALNRYFHQALEHLLEARTIIVGPYSRADVTGVSSTRPRPWSRRDYLLSFGVPPRAERRNSILAWSPSEG